VPPGAALLIQVIGRVIRDFTRHGVVIDARGTDAPRITSEKDLPYGTVIILTRDGDQAKRTDLPEAKISEYVSAALTAVSGGASATGAAQQAGSQSGVGAASGVSI
jgi:hypothetical protein